MKKEKLSAYEKRANKVTAVITGLCIFLCQAAVSFADVFDSAKNSLETITKGLEIVVCPLGTAMGVIALIVYMVSPDPQTAQRGKNWAIRIFLSVALIFAMSNIIDYLSTVFKG